MQQFDKYDKQYGLKNIPQTTINTVLAVIVVIDIFLIYAVYACFYRSSGQVNKTNDSQKKV